MTRLRAWMGLGLAAALLCGTAAAAAPPTDNAALAARVKRVLAATPLVDGHNDLPWEIRDRFQSRLESVDLSHDTRALPHPNGPPLMTDIPRLRAGGVGGQFWSVWIPVELTGPKAVEVTLEQVDLVKRMAAAYPKDFQMAYTAEDVWAAHRAGKIACLIGIEGGHQIDASLPVLRQMYDAGVRYMTLTHSRNTPWADSATDNPVNHGLSPFGRTVVREMNRLGMLVDLSHVSPETMRAALEVSQAPVIFSHSGARAIVDHPRDVPDDILRLVARNGGVVMVNFYPGYVSQARAIWDADEAGEEARLNAPPFGGLYIGQPERSKAALAAWKAAHPAPIVTVSQVADHIDHVRQVAGIDHVGLGSDFDGVPDTPTGLDGVDKFPSVLMELARRGWSDQDLAKLAGGNVLRVMHDAEVVAHRLQASEPASEAVMGPSATLPQPGQ